MFFRLIKLKGEDLFLRNSKTEKRKNEKKLVMLYNKKIFLSSTTRDEYGDMFLFIL